MRRRGLFLLSLAAHGGQTQQDGACLGHVERIEFARQRDAQHPAAAFGHTGAQALVFIAQHQHGGQLHGVFERVGGGPQPAP